MGVYMSTATVDASIDGTEKLLSLDGTTTKTVTPAVLAAYVIDVLAAAAEVAPTAGDALVVERSGTEGTFDIDDLASYVVASAWTVASTVTPAVSGDLLLVNRSGTIYDMDVDTLQTYVLVGVQATVLNTSGLDAATLGATDLFTVCQTTTPKKVALSDLETKLWTDFGTYTAALDAVVTAVDSDKFYCLQGSTAKYVTATVLATYMSAEILAIGDIQDAVLDTLDTYTAALDAVTAPADSDVLYCLQGGTAKQLALLDLATYAVENAFDLPWRLVSTSKYTALPASTSTITMSDTSDFVVGMPVKYVYGGVSYYGVVSAVSANALLTIAGAPLNIAVELTDLYAGAPSSLIEKTFVIDTACMDAAQDIFSAITYERHRWQNSAAYLVSFSATVGVADTGAAQPKINVKIGGALVSTNDSSKGLQVSATPGTWTDNSAIAISTANYSVARGDAIDIRCTEAGTNGDADILSVTLLFVLEQ